MRLIIALLCCLMPLTLKAALGDIRGATIETNGWVLSLMFDSMPTNGQTSFGWGISGKITNDYPTATNFIVLTAVSPGFDDTGTSNTTTRTIYGTTNLFLPYPNQALNDYVTNTGNNSTVIRIALSDFVYSNTVSVSLSVRSGLYVTGGNVSNNAASFFPTNLSILTRQRVIGNWSMPPMWTITNDTYPLRVVAFHRSAQQGRPVRVVKFWASDQHGNWTPTNYQTQCVIDNTLNEQLKVCEYVGYLYSTNLTQGDLVTNYFAAYPWIGDSTTVLDTSTIPLYRTNMMYPCPYLLRRDSNGVWGRVVATVDLATGNDATAIAVDSATGNYATNVQFFSTINAAVNAISGTNGVLHSHKDPAAGIVYLKSGAHTWTGGTTNLHTNSSTWVNIAPYPGLSRDAVSITNRDAAPVAITNPVHLYNLTLTADACVGGTFASFHDAIWLDNCIVTTPTSGSNVFNVVSNFYLTGCLLTSNQLNNGNNSRWTKLALARNNTFSNQMKGNWEITTILGNRFLAQTNSAYLFTGAWCDFYTENGTTRPLTNPIFAYNWSDQLGQSATRIMLMRSNNMAGGAIVQNVIMRGSNGPSSVDILGVYSDGVTNSQAGLMMWHNTFGGSRVNYFYEDTANSPALHTLNSVVGNYFDTAVTKHDVFSTTTINVEGWSVLYGVGYFGNFVLDATNYFASAGATGLTFRWQGINSIWCISSPFNMIAGTEQFTDRRSGSLVINGAGYGDYHPLTTSPLVGITPVQVLPFDLSGNPRPANSSSGAYEPYPLLHYQLPNAVNPGFGY